MVKICAKCGALIENANINQKYCCICTHKKQLEAQANWRKAKKPKLQVIKCKYCGELMRVMRPGQEMHVKCERKVMSAERRKWLQEHPRPTKPSYKNQIPHIERKKPQPAPKYSVGQMDAKARKLGMTYGKYVSLIDMGRVEPPDISTEPQSNEKKGKENEAYQCKAHFY